jgi:hypothetical protein
MGQDMKSGETGKRAAAKAPKSGGIMRIAAGLMRRGFRWH